MTSGIILGMIIFIVCSKFITKRIGSKKLDAVMGKGHKVLAIVALVLTIFHLVSVWKLRYQRPVGMYIAGFVMLVMMLIALASFLLRKQLKKNWFVIHRGAAIIIIGCLCVHVYFGISSLNHYKERISDITLQDVDLSQVEDGSYVGEYDAGYVYAKVKVVIKDGAIDKIELLEHRTEKGKSAESVVEQMYQQQTLKVDAVSSATNSSKVIMKAAENAVQQQ